MSEDNDVVVLDEEQPEEKPPAPTPEPEEPKEKSEEFGKEFFDRFGGKAPHYKLAGTFNINDPEISKKDADRCMLFTTWAKPKRKGLTVEWAEKMYLYYMVNGLNYELESIYKKDLKENQVINLGNSLIEKLIEKDVQEFMISEEPVKSFFKGNGNLKSARAQEPHGKRLSPNDA